MEKEKKDLGFKKAGGSLKFVIILMFLAIGSSGIMIKRGLTNNMNELLIGGIITLIIMFIVMIGLTNRKTWSIKLFIGFHILDIFSYIPLFNDLGIPFITGISAIKLIIIFFAIKAMKDPSFKNEIKTEA